MKNRRGKTIAKSNLPQKQCATCARPFAWRKAWARRWAEIRYCSDQCSRARRMAKPATRRRPKD